MSNDALSGAQITARATMKDVAALAQVSLKTVSRVVNEEPTVNPELAERVRKAAMQLRYQPDFGASALRRRDRRSSQIAVLLEDLANPFSATIYRAIEDVASTRDVTVLGASLGEDPKREHDVVELMTRHRVDAIIIAPASRDHQYLRREQEAGVPFVFVDRTPHLLAADAVLADSRDGARRAVEHLIAHGHRRIAYLGDLATITTTEDRHAGYREALAASQLPYDESIVRLNIRSSEAAYDTVVSMLNMAEPPTAFFTGQNLLTIGAVRALRERNAQHTIALVGFDDFTLADLLEPAVTVVAQDPVAIGRLAAESLFARLGGDAEPVREFRLPVSLVVRGSGELPGPAVR